MHACPALTALARRELITYYTASHLHSALRSEKCMNCNDSGPYFIFQYVDGAAPIALPRGVRTGGGSFMANGKMASSVLVAVQCMTA